MTSRLKPRRSDHLRYIRSSISAQSCDSVPPAPGWMVTMALARSCSPPSIFLVSAASTSCWSSSSPRSRSAPTSSPALRPLDQDAEIVGAPLQRLRSAWSSSSRRRRCITFCASAWLLQKSGLGDALLDVGELLVEAGALKDASAVPPRGGSGRRIAVTRSSSSTATDLLRVASGLHDATGQAAVDRP